MRIKLLSCGFVLCIVWLASCSSPPVLSGYVYAFSNNNLIVTDLSAGKVIADINGPKIDFRYATRINDNTILLSGDNRAWLFDRITSKLMAYVIPKKIASIIMPIYLSKYKNILFYCSDSQLCSMPINNPKAVSVVDTANAHDGGFGGSGYYPIVEISDHEIVYSTDNGTVKYYNLNTKTAGYLPIGKCIPQLWRSKTQQMLCLVFEPKAHYYFIKLDSSDKEPAPDFDGMPAVYIPYSDTVLAGGGKLRWKFPDPIPYEWSELRAYDLKNNSVTDVSSGSWVYQGDTVWFRDVPTPIKKMTFSETKQ